MRWRGWTTGGYIRLQHGCFSIAVGVHVVGVHVVAGAVMGGDALGVDRTTVSVDDGGTIAGSLVVGAAIHDIVSSAIVGVMIDVVGNCVEVIVDDGIATVLGAGHCLLFTAGHCTKHSKNNRKQGESGIASLHSGDTCGTLVGNALVHT